jgi:hypothetical protein
MQEEERRRKPRSRYAGISRSDAIERVNSDKKISKNGFYKRKG